MSLHVCDERGREGQRIEEAIIMPATTVVGSWEKRRKEQRRLCLELSKCCSSGPHSLYQCHGREFSSHLSAQWVFFRSLRARRNAWSLTIAGSTQSTTCTYPAYSIASLNIALCLNDLSFFQFSTLLYLCRVLKHATLHLPCTLFPLLFIKHLVWMWVPYHVPFFDFFFIITK